MNVFDMVPLILKDVCSKDSIDFIHKNYSIVGPFMEPCLKDLEDLKGMPDGRVALAKVYFSLQRYEEALAYLRDIDLKDDGSFFYRQMMFRKLEKYIPPQEIDLDSLGYLFERKKFEEIKECKDLKKILTIAKTDRKFHKWVVENHECFVGDQVEMLHLKIDFLAGKKDIATLQNLVSSLEYPLNYEVSFYLFENYPFVSRLLKGNELLDGTFQKRIYLRFLVMNNKTDFNFLSNLGRHNNKFDSRIITLLSNSIMNMGTTNDSLYRLNTDLISNTKPWNRFIGTSVLGNIHVGNENPYEILQKYLPSEGDLKRGGSLLALGFINKLECREEDIEFFNAFLMDKNLCGEIQYGAALGLGLVAMGSKNEGLLEVLAKLLESASELIFKEGLLIAIGMINAGQAVENSCVEEQKKSGNIEKAKKDSTESAIPINYENILIEVCKESEHERESRSAGIALALSLIGTERAFPDLLRDKNELVRYAGALAFGASFVGTCDLEVVSELLDLAKDMDENVRRSAIFSIGLVCSTDGDTLVKILKPLATNHCCSTRAAIALTLGFFLCGTGNFEASNIIEALLYDNSSLVVQQAGIGMGLLLMQCNSTINCNFKRMVSKLNSLTLERAEDSCFKLGAVIGRAIMEGGGTNILFSVLNSMNRVETSRVVGAIIFFQYWFWYPYFPFLCLCMKPTGFFIFDENLNLSDIKINIDDKKSKFSYECIKIEELKKQRRFKRKENLQPKEEPVIVEEPESYSIKSGDRITMQELKACGIEDFRFIFLNKNEN